MRVFTLSRGGLEVRISPFGGTILSIRVPDGTNVVHGYENLSDYQSDPSFKGGIIGRYANRIANARFSLDGVEYPLTANDGPNHLHGGVRGFHKVEWEVRDATDRRLELEYTSPDGEEGYPGNLAVSVRYSLTDQAELQIEMMATTNRPTVVNLTMHPYFNLAGKGDTRRHEVFIEANSYLETDAAGIPTGNRQICGTGFSLCHFDHTFIISRRRDGLSHAARVRDPESGREMEILTSCWRASPGLQFYTGQHLREPYAGLCLEPQHFPDSPNRPEFPSTRLNLRASVTAPPRVYRFQSTGPIRHGTNS